MKVFSIASLAACGWPSILYLVNSTWHWHSWGTRGSKKSIREARNPYQFVPGVVVATHDILSVTFCPDELETMLKDQTSSAPNKSSPSSLSPALAESQSSSLSNYAGLTNATISTPSSILHTPDFGLPQDYQPSSLTFTGVTPPLKSFIAPADNHPEEMKVPTTAAVISEIQADTTSFLSQGFGYDVIWPAWPRDLPSPSLVRHL